MSCSRTQHGDASEVFPPFPGDRYTGSVALFVTNSSEKLSNVWKVQADTLPPFSGME